MITTKLNEVIEKFEAQYFYSEKVGTYVLNFPDKTILFDLPTYSKKTHEYLLTKNRPYLAFLSHGSCGIADGSKWQKVINLKVYLHEKDKNSKWLQMTPDVLYTQPPELPKNLELVHTPGHSLGSVCLLEKQTKTLLTGDTIEGTKNGEIYDFTKQNDPDVQNRLESANKLLNYDFRNILPFHYEPIFNTAKQALRKFIAANSFKVS